MSKQMNTSNNQTETTTTAAANAATTEIHAKYKGILHNTSLSARENGAFVSSAEQNLDALDAFLEDEKQHNKTKTWNKLDKTMRAQKLQKTKEVMYDKDTREVLSVAGLAFHPETHEFFIRITDAKHVSTIKSLTPKRNNV